MECKFVVGQKVVCIHDKWGVFINPGYVGIAPPPPRIGLIYSIAGIEPDGTMILLQFKEYPLNCGYDHRAFRPLQDRPKEADTDISVFTPLLNAKTLEPVT
jgi:hypothetical protein